MSSIIFAMMEPAKTVLDQYSSPTVPVTGDTGTVEGDGVVEAGVSMIVRMIKREGGVEGGGSSDAVGLIFRIGGVSAAVGAFVCMRLARNWRNGQGI